MTDEERYLFDLQGYLVIPNAIEPEVVSRMNTWADSQAEKNPAFKGAQKTQQLQFILGWSQDFRQQLDNPKVLPYLVELLGEGLRLDHDYAIFLQPGGGGLWLHGGATPYDPTQFYHCVEGKFFNGLTVAVYSLSDVPEGCGGFACIPGSHKSQFRCPEEIRVFQRSSPIVKQVPVKAGDCIVFTEALMHGTLPWTGAGTRRTLFYKYSPGYLGWSNRPYYPAEHNQATFDYDAEWTETQRKILQAPGIYQRANIYG